MSCLAITKQNKQCSRNAKIGSYCAQHSTLYTNEVKDNTTIKKDTIIKTTSKEIKENVQPSDILNVILSESIINENRTKIYNEIGLNANFVLLPENKLKDLFQLYDKYFFNSKISSLLQNEDRTLTFKISTSLTKTAGRLHTLGLCHTLEISLTVLQETFCKGENVLKINGLKVKNRLEALCNIFEHELTHLIIHLIKPKTKDIDYSSHGKKFYNIVNGYFKHTECRHGLLAGDSDVKEQQTAEKKSALKVGDTVTFLGKDKVMIMGIIERVNAKTVSVKEGNIKYRIPYGLLL